MPRHPLQPTPLDDVETDTSKSQVSTELDISSILLDWLDRKTSDQDASSYQPIDTVLLTRSRHVDFLYPPLFGLPGKYTGFDATRTWIMYWTIGALSVLDIQLKSEDRLRAIQTMLSFQNPQGGFGGGPDQLAHLAATYASVCTIAILLDGADQSLIDSTCAQIDSTKMYHWLLSLKSPDGSFAVHNRGETDVRASFAVVTIATLLNFLTPELVRNLPEYLVSCQTYEGGIAATSVSKDPIQSLGPLVNCPRAAPTGEAHGGYASCALASYFLLQGLPSTSASPKLDYDSLLRWTTHMQALPVEGGGFRGRTNKLVDGCYSWWCGGMFPLLQALITSESPNAPPANDLFDRQALQEYILLISQDMTPGSKGGLRDKPSTKPDFYHTQYVLAGLSLAQHSQTHSLDRIQDLQATFSSPDCSRCILGESESQDQAIERMKQIYSRALAWEVDDSKKLVVGMVSNEILPVHPVFNIKQSAAESIMKWFYHQN